MLKCVARAHLHPALEFLGQSLRIFDTQSPVSLWYLFPGCLWQSRCSVIETYAPGYLLSHQQNSWKTSNKGLEYGQSRQHLSKSF